MTYAPGRFTRHTPKVNEQTHERWENGHEPVAHSPDEVPGYENLRRVLEMAYDQSARGKGKERHANGKPFHKQPTAEHGRIVGPAGPAFQVMKKAGEAVGMANRGERDKAVQEMLGAIVYCAFTVLLLLEQE